MKFRLLIMIAILALSGVDAFANCSSPANVIEAENCKPGTPQTTWDINGSGDLTIQGFTTDISVNIGQKISFKINTDATNYKLDIYRVGYYGGNGARFITTVTPTAVLPQNQPACLTDGTTGLIDCGSWDVSASWTVPSTATSGVYFAKVTRLDTGGASHILFIVRNDSSHSALFFQTADTQWEAYNNYGGNSLYVGGPGVNPGRAYKVSYNRPFNTRGFNPLAFFWDPEYPMIRWLEANGYDVSYTTGMDTDRLGTLILQHKVFLSVGHDEYWSGGQRANVEAARAAGVHLAFFSGNEVFWKTRWEASIDGSNTSNRTLVCYKETHASAVTDPADPPTWTGTWRDPRFSPPADGGRPENALTGTIFRINGPRNDSITVPDADGKMRFWRNTTVASLASGQSATLASGSLGYEWDEDADNGFRPPGLIRLSTTTISVPDQYLLDFGHTYGTGTAIHHLTMYRHPSGALVFGAGTVRWSWGLDGNHDNGTSTADINMQQATVNLLGDMGVQPATLQGGLLLATASTDTTPPTSTITSLTSGSTLPGGITFNITGTASDAGGGIVGGVEVSVDGGTTWHPAIGRENWSYAWTPNSAGSVTIKSRAVDDSGNLENPSSGVTVTVTAPTSGCPCTIWNSSATPAMTSASDNSPVEVGVKFRSDFTGFVSGIRFYKGPSNTGTHVGHLWTSSGTQLAAATFTNETPTGWQQMIFATPVTINANTTYVASYFAPSGGYAADASYFASSGVDHGTLHALANGVDGPNGVFVYGSSFPTQSFNSINYWVDVVFNNVAPPVISGVGSSNVTAHGAVITWTTNTASTSQVEYGSTTAYGSITTINTGLVTSHSVALSGLAENSLAHYRVWSQDSSGNVGVSGDFTFTTAPDAVPPIISGVAASSLTPTGATITWTTDEVSDSQVDYGTTTTYGGSSALNSNLVTSHRVIVSGLTPNTFYHFRAKSRDASGNLSLSGDFTFTTLSAAAYGCPCTIWPSTAVPRMASAADTSGVELGVKFRSDVSGIIAGIKFYKGTNNTGTHVAHLYTSTGTLLGTATFTNETATGWQTATFATPVAILANTTYVASYFAPAGGYAADMGYFGPSGFDRGPLHALQDGLDGGNGIYRYGGGLPNSTFNSANYWVDVVLSASGPMITGVGSSGVASSTATIQWTTDIPSTSQLEYGSTTAYGSMSTINVALVTNHSVTLSGLAENSLYHYRVWSKDGSNNPAVSGDFTFTTTPDGVPPVISGVTASSITPTGATITWTTDELSNSQVDYGTTTAYANSITPNPSTVINHSVLLSGLSANTLYHFRVRSQDLSGNLSISGDFTFTTPTASFFGCPCSIWPSTATPAVASAADTGAVELGVKFQSDVSGHITGIKFYRGANNTGTHVAHLYTSAGTLLATATFTNETATGWQTATFATPVAILANTTYVASYFAPTGGYSVDQSYFTSSGFDSIPLHALSNGASGGNGVFIYSPTGGFPTSAFKSSNYWVDVVLGP